MYALILATLVHVTRGDPGPSTLRALTVRSDVAAVVEVVWVSGAGSERRAAVRPTAIAFGEAPQRFEVDADVGRTPAFPQLTVGSRWLMFFETRERDGKRVLDPSGAAFTDRYRFLVTGDGDSSVVRWNSHVDEPPGGLLREVAIPLAKLLVLIREFRPGKRPATFRLRSIECATCDFQAVVKNAVSPSASRTRPRPPVLRLAAFSSLSPSDLSPPRRPLCVRPPLPAEPRPPPRLAPAPPSVPRCPAALRSPLVILSGFRGCLSYT